MLIDYVNTELFNVGLPIKIVENRKNFESNLKKTKIDMLMDLLQN